MLKTSDRSTYLDSLKPPQGFKVDYIVGTTFSLDLNTVLSTSLALCLFERDEEKMGDPIALLEASKRMSEKMIILHEPGQIQHFKNYHPLYFLVESSLFPTIAPKGGVFHPKLWFVRYSDKNGSQIFRLNCLSRNITFDSSWDFILSLSGERGDTQNSQCFPVNHLFKVFKPKTLNQKQNDLYEMALDDIRYFNFENPLGVKNISFHPLGDIKKKWRDPIDVSKFDRACIVSPFLSDEALKSHLPDSNNNTLVSSGFHLNQIKKETLENIGNVFVLDDNAVAEDVMEEKEIFKDVDDSLHAKMFAYELGRKVTWYIGSANATSHAFNNNVEFLVSFTGKKEEIGIEKFLSEENLGFGKVLNCFTPREEGQSDSEKKQHMYELELLKIKKKIFRMAISYEWFCEENKYQLSLKCDLGNSDLSSDKVRISVNPVSLGKDSAQNFVFSEKTIFKDLDLKLLTRLFRFKVELMDYEDFPAKYYIQKISGPDFPEERTERVIEDIIKSKEDFIRYLFFMLSDGELPPDIPDPSENKNDNLHGHSFATSVPLFEELLEALSRSPDTIKKIQETVESLKKNNGEIIPEKFLAVWSNIEKAYMELDHGNN